MAPVRVAMSGLVIGALAGCAQWRVAPEADPAARAAGVSAQVQPWQAFKLPGKASTRYDLVWQDGHQVLRARAESSASMWRRPLRLDSGELGQVRFSWKVPQLIEAADLSDGDTEDAPVRLVLAFDGDHGRLSMRNRLMFDLAESLTGERPPYATLMYVWDTRAEVETVLHAARSDRIRKVVVESGGQRCRSWLSYQRDIVADFRRAFGEEPGALIGVAVMTDADNTRSRTEAFYGPIELLGGKAGPLALL